MSENVVTAPAGEKWFSIDRTFAAPRRLIWRCYTEPQHLARFWGPRDARTTSTVDLRAGGVWHTHWTYANGGEYRYTSVYLELVEPERIHYRDAPNGWRGGLDGLPPAEMLTTIRLDEAKGVTTVAAHVEFLTVAARDEASSRGFTGMVSLGNDRLTEYLTELAKGEA